MFSVHAAASIYYYLNMKEGQDPEKVLLSDSTGPDGKPNYYDPLAAGDPLAVQAVWAGKLAMAFGYPAGSAVSKQALAAAWFAVDPKDGKTSLLQNGPSISEQVQAQQAIALAETTLFNASANLDKIRSKLFNEGASLEDISADKRVEKLTEDVRLCKEALATAKKDPRHRADAHDCTFSAPKGVSVHWARLKTEGEAGDAVAAQKAKDIEKAMVDSVTAVIEGYIEPQLLFTRSREGGHKEVSYENVKGIASALFLHFDARPTQEEISDPTAPGGRRMVARLPDPQMHVHSLLMAMGLDHNDEIKGLWTTFLGSHAKAIGAAFRGELAHKLRGMGLDLKQDEQKKILGFDLSGVTDEVAGEFSARRAQVVANIAEGHGSEAAVLMGRETKADYTGKDLLGDWTARMDAMGLSSREIESTKNTQIAADQANESMLQAANAGALDFEAGSAEWSKLYERKYAAALAALEGEVPTVKSALEKLLAMETAFTMTDIHRISFEASQFCGALLKEGQTPMQWAEAFRGELLRSPELKQVHDYDKYGRPSFTSHGLVRREKELYYKSIPKMLEARDDALTLEKVDAAIALYEATESEKKGVEFKLRDFQKDMVREMAMNPGSVHVALAPAGCGKTTAALGAVLALEAEGGRVYSLAPSNKAAQGLAQDLRKARSDGVSPQLLLSRIKSGAVKLGKKDVLFIDEASMLDFETAKGLVDAALNAEGGCARIILMGDTEQLPAVGRGNFLRSLAESESFTTENGAGHANISRVASSAADWDRINRQRDDLGKLATTYFALGETGRALDVYERMGALKLSATREEAVTDLAYDAYLPMAGVAEDYNEIRAGREERFKAFFKRGNDELRSMARAGLAFEGPQAFAARFPEAERASAVQWLEDKEALEGGRRALIKAYSNTLMLATKNKDVDDLNNKAREILKMVGAIGGADGLQRAAIPRGKVGMFEICEGERLIFTAKADAALAKFDLAGDTAAKSTVGTVVGMSKDARGDLILVMELDGQKGSIVTVNTRVFDSFNYAYALTAHASQGATCDNVYKLISDFAAMQTEYVGDSRHRDALYMRAVESEYAVYKKKAGEAIEKSDAKDLAFAATSFNLDAAQLANLDQAWETGRATSTSQATAMEAARLRAIAQGILLAQGHAPLGHREGQKDSYFVTMRIEGREQTLWGSGLEAAVAALGAQAGDHVGFEALGGARAVGEGLQWRGYSSQTLKNAGLLLDEDGVASRAKKVMAARSGADKAERAELERALRTEFVSDKEAESLARAMIAKASAVSGMRAKERGVLEELNRMAELPADLEARLRAATAVLPFAKRGASEPLRQALSHGIDAMPYQQPMFKSGREWLAVDSELAYCVTEWGSIEAWSAKNLSSDILSEARALGGSVDRLAARRQQAVDDARRIALDPIKESLGKLGSKVEVSIVEHAKYGLCVGVAATVAGTHKTDPDLKRLFAGHGEYGQEAHRKVGGIGGLKFCKGFDPSFDSWLFPIKCDEMGAPKGEQRAVSELVELGERLGHSAAALSDWDVRRAAAWESIESRLSSTWGFSFSRANAEMGLKVASASQLLADTLKGKSKDIVRWDGRAMDDLDMTREWELCPASGQARVLEGVVLHSDDRDVFVLRGQRVMAIERSLLEVDGASKDWLGKRVAISFTSVEGPKVLSLEDDRLMEKGKELAARIAAGQAPDLGKMSASHAAVFARMSGSAAMAPDQLGHALAWSRLEAAEMDHVRKVRAEGLGVAADSALPLESYFAPAKMAAKKVKVEAVGAAGALLRIGGKLYLADKDQARQAAPRGLSAGRTIDTLKFARDALGRIQIDAIASAKAARAAGPVNS